VPVSCRLDALGRSEPENRKRDHHSDDWSWELDDGMELGGGEAAHQAPATLCPSGYRRE
jgi:hypothetical protein